MPAHDGANSNKGGVQGLLDLLKEAGKVTVPATGTATWGCCLRENRRPNWGALFTVVHYSMTPPGTDREDCRRFGAVKRFCHNVKCANYGIVQLVRPNGVPVACAPIARPASAQRICVSCDPACSSCVRCRSRFGSPAHLQVPGEGLFKAAATTDSILPVAAAGRE